MVVSTEDIGWAKVKAFIANLIVEVTSVCNRACTGCYAPNVVSNKSAAELMEKDASLFLDHNQLDAIFDNWTSYFPEIVSIRGGEPSLHPQVVLIFEKLKKISKTLIFETHGRWLLEKNRFSYKDLISGVKRNDVTVKISFDSMHGLKADELREMTDFLTVQEIPFLVAITELTEIEFLQTRSLCSWIESDKIIFQKKSRTLENLIKPSIGVINAKGEFQENLTAKFDIRELIKEAVLC